MTTLTTRGYTVLKESLSIRDHEKIRDDLTVHPFNAVEYGMVKPVPFKIYQESNTKLYMPKAYGLKRFGIPSVIKIGDGTDIDIAFTGSLRNEQLEPVTKFIEACKDPLKMGGIITVPCGFGKCLGKDTPVMMSDGTVKYVQDVIPGDELMGDDSTPRYVISTCQGRENLYKVKNMKDGTFYVANESHVLSLKCKGGARHDMELSTYLSMQLDQDEERLYGYRVEVDFPHRSVSEDPYIIGCSGFLPVEYIINSRQVRSKTLAGVIDTFSNTIYNQDWDFLNKVIYLARSLGYTALVLNSYTINIIKDDLRNPIEIEPLGEGDYFGFELSGNGRFLLGDFTVTHNTTMAIYIMCQLKKKSLIVVHKDFLLQQWRERIQQFAPSAKIGLIKAQTLDCDGKDIVLASLQSLSMKEYDLDVFGDFGMAVFDECHHLGAEVFSEALKKLNFKYTLGLSATPRRKDGLSKVFTWHLGDIVFNISKRTDVLEVRLKEYFNSSGIYCQEAIMGRGQLNVSRMINNICDFQPRIKFVCNLIAQIIEEEEKRKILILSDRRAHIDALMLEIGMLGFEAAAYYGGLKESQLKEAETKQVIGATYQFASEGLDIAGLDTLILASPKTDIVQCVGRILRSKPEDRVYMPLVIDVIDNFSIFPKQAKKRLAYYKKCKYTIVDDDDVFTDKTQVNLPKRCLISE